MVRCGPNREYYGGVSDTICTFFRLFRSACIQLFSQKNGHKPIFFFTFHDCFHSYFAFCLNDVFSICSACDHIHYSKNTEDYANESHVSAYRFWINLQPVSEMDKTSFHTITLNERRT